MSNNIWGKCKYTWKYWYSTIDWTYTIHFSYCLCQISIYFLKYCVFYLIFQVWPTVQMPVPKSKPINSCRFSSIIAKYSLNFIENYVCDQKIFYWAFFLWHFLFLDWPFHVFPPQGVAPLWHRSIILRFTFYISYSKVKNKCENIPTKQPLKWSPSRCATSCSSLSVH